MEEAKGNPAEERDFLLMKLEAIDKVVKLLGADGSLLVDNIKKVIAAKAEEEVSVDEEGNVKIE